MCDVATKFSVLHLMSRHHSLIHHIASMIHTDCYLWTRYDTFLTLARCWFSGREQKAESLLNWMYDLEVSGHELHSTLASLK